MGRKQLGQAREPTFGTARILKREMHHQRRDTFKLEMLAMEVAWRGDVYLDGRIVGGGGGASLLYSKINDMSSISHANAL